MPYMLKRCFEHAYTEKLSVDNPATTKKNSKTTVMNIKIKLYGSYASLRVYVL